MNLEQFRSDVLHGRRDAIQAFIHALAKERGNQQLLTLAQRYTYRSWHREDSFEGHRVILARDLARLCYEDGDTSTLGKLLKRYDVEFLTIGTSGYNDRRFIIDHFGLNKHTSQANFVAWPHVLLAGAKGDTEFACKMWTYIQEQLTYAEADQESREQTGLGVQENLQRQSAAAAFPELRAIIELVEGVAQARLAAHEAQIQAARAEVKAEMAIQHQHWFTIAEYVYQEKLERQFPEKLWPEFGRYLTGYCLEKGIPMRNMGVIGKPYPSAHGYHVEVLAQCLEPWLKRQYAIPLQRVK